MTAPTRSAGTPHEHIYLWIEDPANELDIHHLEPALDKHLKYCVNAYKRHHRYRADGTDGAITVRHNPPLAELTPEMNSNIKENSQTYAETGEVYAPTQGAQYLASQLAHLPVGDFYADDKETPPMALIEGAALAWVSPYNWFRHGQGMSDLA